MIYDIRPMIHDDLPDLCEMLNHTIHLGGTTAYEMPFTPDTFAEEFLVNKEIVSSLVAHASGGARAGFQCLFDDRKRTDATVGIGSFTDQRTRFKGAGQALFVATKAAAIALGYPSIQAKIRADNVPGLKYYRSLGFTDHAVIKDVPLADGTPVDRIVTLFELPRD
ncbi:GNAT family N-acetyltransferase [Actibacterium sp. 188UL27-1]|uniref:GNAT family N-acetyltransferase n=1 Tax=Actibacterium sp. 188UL27-1 TaxID=2786961 RepID=UPI001957BBC5|nr:GNAT family N-acetyltransferase [Actibacterium sp. 188UL27-1]MBM7067222.1 GNAT family N-acetyltransferase [Actibacterium sp. 188UL27-1]